MNPSWSVTAKREDHKATNLVCPDTKEYSAVSVGLDALSSERRGSAPCGSIN